MSKNMESGSIKYETQKIPLSAIKNTFIHGLNLKANI